MSQTRPLKSSVPFGQHADLSRFAQEFTNEAHLRSVLRDLLTRMNAKKVRITHGTNERGKDIVFVKEGGLSKDVLYACVVKKERITGRADSNSGAQTVLNQALQALNEPYTDRATGADLKVHTVYIISPNECTPEAVESIKRQLNEQARRVEFICGIDLLALFQDHWPDFLRFESAILTRYLSGLSTGLSVDNALISLLTRHNANLGLKPFESIYVANQLEVHVGMFEAPTVPVPLQDALTRYQTWEELQETLAQLRFWRRALRAPELAGEQLATLTSLLNFVDQFSKMAKTYWELAVKSSRFRKRPEVSDLLESSNKPKRPTTLGHDDSEERQIGVPPEMQMRFTQCLAIFDRVNQQLVAIHRTSSEVRKAAFKIAGGISKLVASDAFRFLSLSYDYLTATPGLLKRRKRPPVLVDPESLFTNCRAVLVAGPPGSGKTSFCRWQTLRAIERFSADLTQPLPVYVPAHRFASTPPDEFEDFFLGTDVRELWPEVSQRRNVAIRLFVDGLDELPDRDQQRRLIEALRKALEHYPHLVVVVTARPYVWGSWLNWLPRVHMAELSGPEQRTLAVKWLDDERLVTAFFAQLEASSALKKLMGTPLLATLILNLYRKTPAIPENKASLYRAFVDLYSGGWDVAKGLYKAGQFGNEQKLRPLPGLAYRMHLSNRTDCGESNFVQAVADTMPSLVRRATDLLSEIIQDGILVRIGQDIVFAHLSFQEYLAAQYLASDPMGKRPARALRSFLKGEDWWKEVVEFYLISRDDPAALDDWIERTSNGVGRRRRPDQDDERDTDVLTRLDVLATILTEAFSGYSAQFNKPISSRRESVKKAPKFQ